MLRLDELEQLVLVPLQVLGLDLVDEAVGTRVDDQHLLLDRHGLVLPLLEDLHQPAAAGDLPLGGRVQVRSELGEGRHLAVLGKVQPEPAGHLLHGPDLRVAADTGNRQAHVDGGTNARVEQVRLQIDLAVGDGDDVGRDVGGDVARLGLDDRQGRQRAAALLVAHLGRALQQPGMQVEDVARKGLAAGRAAQQQGELPVGHRVLGQVVVDGQGVAAVVADVLAHGAAAVRSDVLERRRLRGGGRHHDGVVHGAVLPELIDHLGHGGALLAHGDIDTGDVAALLVDDGVDADRGLAGLAVADDQLPLAAPDGDHGVDGLEPGLQRLHHRLALNDAGSLELDAAALRGLDGAAAVDGLAERVHDPASQRVAHRDLDDAAGAVDAVTFLDEVRLAEQRRADVVLLEVERHAEHVVGELQELSGGGVVETVDPGDAVARGQDGADLLDGDALVVVLDLLLDDAGYFGGADLHGSLPWMCAVSTHARV